MRISDWSSDVCSSDLNERLGEIPHPETAFHDMAAPITDAGSGVVRNRPVPAALDRSLGEVVARGKAFSGTAQNDDTNIVVDIGLFQYGEQRSEEHTSELQSLMRISYAVFCLKKKHTTTYNITNN